MSINKDDYGLVNWQSVLKWLLEHNDQTRNILYTDVVPKRETANDYLAGTHYVLPTHTYYDPDKPFHMEFGHGYFIASACRIKNSEAGAVIIRLANEACEVGETPTITIEELKKLPVICSMRFPTYRQATIVKDAIVNRLIVEDVEE